MRRRAFGTLAGRLRDGETLYGLLTKMPNPAALEMAGHVGFDFGIIDTEHGIADSEILEHHLRAADSVGIEILVRVGSAEKIESLRALDAGAAGIIVPHVNDAEGAEAAVGAAHYPPVGERGLAVSTRAGGHGSSPVAEHVRDALEDTLVVVQVEHADALENLEEITTCDHVDVVFLGPNDLAISLGYPGDMSHPEVMDAVEHVVQTVAKGDVAALCVLANSEAEAHVWKDRGARVILFSATAVLHTCLTRIIVNAKRPGCEDSKRGGKNLASLPTEEDRR